MVCLLIDEKMKIRKFKTIERADKYMERHEGFYFLIEYSNKFLWVSVVESSRGQLTQIKGTSINRYDNQQV